MIKEAQIEDINEIVKLMYLLFPNSNLIELEKEMKEFILSDEVIIFLSLEKDTLNPIGFAQCQLRYDYVEGTITSPVGYLEGIYVKENKRNQGIAKQLVKCCEEWVRKKGCREFASDCELSNVESLKFHLKVGFEEANRLICFKKKL